LNEEVSEKDRGKYGRYSEVATKITALAYVILTTGYNFIFYPPSDGFIRLVSGTLLLASIWIVFWLNKIGKLSRFYAAYLTPTFVMLINITVAAILGGDSLFFFFMIGCSLLSLTFLDKKALTLYLITANVYVILAIYVFNLTLLPESTSALTQTIQFVACNFINALVYYVCVFSYEWVRKYDEASAVATMAEVLKYREDMVTALNKMAIILLSHEAENFDDVMDRGIKPIAATVGLDRIAVYRFAEEKERFSQVYLWIGKTMPLEEFMLDMPMVNPVLRWYDYFIKGECINANIADMYEDEVAYLSRFGIKAIYFAPVFVSGSLWGVITLEDHKEYKYFDDKIIDLLQSAAHLCAGAVVRKEMEREIHYTKTVSDEKTRFLAMMSHEIRNPLTVIATGIDFADEQALNSSDVSDIRGTLNIVRNETQRLGRMVSGMLKLASINKDTDENRKRTDFSALLHDSAEVFRLTLERHKNEINVNIAPNLPDVYVEADRFAQIMTNLLTNASEHTRNGKIILSATFDDAFITVKLSDTGAGIESIVVPHVFERGMSGKGGTGYGLYICKTIVEAHGGTIKVESKKNKGTTITFTVPVYGGQEITPAVT